MNKTLISAACVIFLATGCASNASRTAQDDAKLALNTITAQQEAFKKTLIESNTLRIAAQDVNRPFIAGSTRPLAREASMPAFLRNAQPVTLLTQRGPMALQSALQLLSEASGVLMTATPDASMPSSMFAPKVNGQTSPLMAPVTVSLVAQNAPLVSVLDDLARQQQLHWRVKGSGVEFYRIDTRSFQIAGIPQIANTSASLGRNGGKNEVFESQSKSAFETKDQNPINGIVKSVTAMLSNGGLVTASPENQTVVVTDTPEVLDKIDAFIKENNKMLNRRVRIMLEAIEVVDKDGSELGVDWNLMYSKANAAIATTAAGSLASTQAGSFKLSSPAGRFAGSSIVVNALSEVGVVVNRRAFPFLTTSGRPVTQALRTTFNYVDQAQATAVSSSAATVQAPTVTQKDETVGTFLTVVPTAKSDGTIVLSIALDETKAAPLVPFSVGPDSARVTVQQKTIDGNGVIQEVPMRSGQTIVIGGLESSTSSDTVRRLIPGSPLILGGSNAAKITKTRTLLLLTAVAEEGV